MKLNSYDTQRVFDYENGYFISADDRRIGKFIVHLELYKKITHLPGAVVECGVFKGNSFFEWVHFRNILETQASRKIIGFDTFGEFPQTNFEEDKQKRQAFIDEAGKGISYQEMQKALAYKKIENYELIKGDINETLPKYCKEKPELRIALLHIDTDVYEPALTILENMYERVVGGGDYNV
ncbi:TylF/MycF family methyltransferase [Helicobacter mesocricetorum]|uniref:TylF/MycF family methyltransferase n=1 Tax=Helicobacter mesocricetorum TaxID=87012 RepID=UPI001F275B51|nr:TylF/MycF family methyltransferase [Helicobacter mesocricetorum]